MKWLTLELIKGQLRLDPEMTLEDGLLELYGSSAEDAVLALLRRTLTNVMVKYDGVPDALVHASLLLVDHSYKERSPVSSQNLSAIPYSFDLLLKPYMRLSGEEDDDGAGLPYGMLFGNEGKALVGWEMRFLCGAIE